MNYPGPPATGMMGVAAVAPTAAVLGWRVFFVAGLVVSAVAVVGAVRAFTRRGGKFGQ